MMQNKYAKGCAKCGTLVQAYQGVCEKVNNVWVVEHVECHTPSVEIQAAQAKLAKIQGKSEPTSTHPAFAPIEAFQWMEDEFEFHSH